ncbi:caspase family protein [Deltaproteobacteria bacterium TL4]
MLRFLGIVLSSLIFVSSITMASEELRGISLKKTDTADENPVTPEEKAPAEGTYRALLIGNNDYKYWPTLKTAVLDVSALGELLISSYGFRKENVTLLQNADRRQLLESLSHLKKVSGKEDSVLIYYAGHGQYDEGEEGYWVPVDGKKDDTIDYIPNTTLLTKLRAIDAAHKFIIADSCFSGNLLTRGASKINADLMRKNRYFREKNKLKSVQGLSSGGNEPVFDGGAKWEGHSIFAYHLLALLKANQRPYLAASLLGVQLTDNVTNDTATRDGVGQTPILQSINNQGHQGGEFFFVRPDFQKKRTILVYETSPELAFEKVSAGARNTIRLKLVQYLKNFPQLNIVTDSLSVSSQHVESALPPLMEQEKAEIAIVYSILGNMTEQVTLMWEGIATMELSLSAYERELGVLNKIDHLSIPSQRFPLRKWPKEATFQEEQYEKVASKVANKWSQTKLRGFVTNISE